MSLDDQISAFLRGKGWRLSATAAYLDVISPSGLYTIRVSTNGSWEVRRGTNVVGISPETYNNLPFSVRIMSACAFASDHAKEIAAGDAHAASSMMRANDRPAGNEMSAL